MKLIIGSYVVGAVIMGIAGTKMIEYLGEDTDGGGHSSFYTFLFDRNEEDLLSIPDEDNEYIGPLSPEEVQEFYDEKQIYTLGVANNLTATINTNIEKGTLATLDSYLESVDEMYKDDPLLGFSYENLILKYRKDLATSFFLINNIDDSLISDHLSNYSCPDVLLSTYLMLEPSVKSQVTLSMQSIVFPPFYIPDWETNYFAEITLSWDEQIKIINTLNLERNETSKFTGVKKYIFPYKDIEWVATLVCNSDFYYSILSIETLNKENSPASPITVDVVKNWRSFLTSSEINSFVYNTFEESLHNNYLQLQPSQ